MKTTGWVCSADGTLVNLAHLVSIRLGAAQREEGHRVLGAAVDGTDVLLFAGAEADARRVLADLQSHIGARGLA